MEQQTRKAAFDLPMKARQWRDHYRSMGYEEFLVREFCDEIDTVMMPALTRMYEDGLITPSEYTRIGGTIWAIWADYHNEVMNPPKESIWTRIVKWIMG